jgi:pentose-5-phosphate-3-epimerase
MKELGDAINTSLSESDDIAQVIARIKEEGYDISLVLEPEFSINAHDVRFLKSLRISVDDAA